MNEIRWKNVRERFLTVLRRRIRENEEKGISAYDLDPILIKSDRKTEIHVYERIRNTLEKMAAEEGKSPEEITFCVYGPSLSF